ncbi:UDP-glycosyltransferase 90A1 [Sesamum alatum]|uniref:Glycosyltransferase n=1 Tax=Sesamum alatum TaxID=300844 RepID=A0AAE1YUU7_9LAMI|nr:UDP-glycosyltransferase 90A1 [Sesamum alatum]
MGSLTSPHFVIFPFMSQGHTIPVLYLSRLLHSRSAAVTIFTTPGNSPPIRAFLQDTDVSVIELPFPQNVEGVPPGVENTHKLPSMASFPPFVESTKLMQKSFEQVLESLSPPVSCVISDGFLGWTLNTAKKFGVPRFAFYGMGNFSFTMHSILSRERPHASTKSLDEPFSMSDFPELKFTRNDFESPYNDIEPSGPLVEFMVEQLAATAISDGIIVNSFYELEQRYADYWNNKFGPKALCVGPLCMAAPPSQALDNPIYTEFLDRKLAEGEPVLYVAFGSQAEVSAEQLQEIAEGLEQSQVSFLWTLKPNGSEFLQKFEERVKSRGIVVKGWVDQQQILRHDGVKGFLSHCGWNSVMESISAGVPILAMPFIAEQHINARFLAEVAGLGLRIMPRSGSVRGFVAAEEVERKVRELMGGEKGAEVRKKAAEYRDAASNALKEGGSSIRTLDMLIEDVARKGQTFSGGGSAGCCLDGQDFDSDHKNQRPQF